MSFDFVKKYEIRNFHSIDTLIKGYEKKYLVWRRPSYLKERLKVFTDLAYLTSVLRYLDLFDV